MILVCNFADNDKLHTCGCPALDILLFGEDKVTGHGVCTTRSCAY